MGLKATVQNKVVRYLFGTNRRDANRRKAERVRRSKRHPHIVEYFHDISDPYSHLMVQVLPDCARRHNIELRVHISPPPPDWAAPDRNRLDAYARKDAESLAKKAGLTFRDPGQQPSQGAIAAANTSLLEAVETGAFLRRAREIGDRAWGADLNAPASEPPATVAETLSKAGEHRDALGHYLGATLYYAGEWYWGVDRLHYLEARLLDLGAMSADRGDAALFSPPTILNDESTSKGSVPELHWYLSFRSPYTGIVHDRIKKLADAYGADLKLRYVLPMVMRGMQVPRKKGFYIMSDAVREAERLGVPFGNFADPVGTPVERGYAILHEAIRRGRGYEFVQSFLSGVWSEGIDAGSDKGLKAITERAGLSWADMKPLIGGDHWRDEAEANQQEMFSHGIWGVPSFRVGNVATWGQDRLWLVEDALKKAVEK